MGFNTLVKGKDILNYDWSLRSRSLEMRINVSCRMFRVGSLPNYDSVVQADKPETIYPATPFRFFLEGLNSKNKMTITKLETVNEFDNSMWANQSTRANEIIQ